VDLKQEIYRLLEQGQVQLISAQMSMNMDRAFTEPYIDLCLELRIYPSYNPETGKQEPVTPNFVGEGLRALGIGE
jgi:hypothetical protein